MRTNQDSSAPFASYRTFAFHQPINSEEAGFTNATRLLKAATREELEARGLSYSDTSPQIQVDFRATLAEQMRTQPATPSYNGMDYSPYASPWYPSLKAQPPVQSRYSEGTVVIQVIDVAKKQMVWEAQVVDVVSPGMSADPKPAIDAAVHAAFERYPVAPAKARY